MEITVIRKINVDSDLKALRDLVDFSTLQLFGNFDLEEKIETSCLSYCLTLRDEIIAALILDDCPNLSLILPSIWPQWFQKLYRRKAVTTQNSLWLHWFVHPEKQIIDFKEIFKKIFFECDFLEFILLLKMPNTPKKIWMKDYFKCYLPAINCRAPKFNEIQTLFLMERKGVISLDDYYIYKATPEEYDNLKRFLAKVQNSDKGQFDETANLKEKIAEDNGDDEKPLIAVEWCNNIIGLIALNAKLNFRLLATEFDLGPFTYFRKNLNEFSIAFKEISRINVHSSGIDDELQDFERFSFKDTQLEIIERSQSEINNSLRNSGYFSIPDFSKILNIRSLPESDGSDVDSLNEIDIDNEQLDSSFHKTSNQSRQSVEKEISTENPRKSVDVDPIEDDMDPNECNAFAVESILLHEENQMEIQLEILKMGFKSFPDREYCLISVPSNYPLNSITKLFTKVAPKSNSTYLHDLYVLHRASIFGTFSVRKASSTDEEYILKLVPKCKHFETIQTNLKINILQQNRVFVFLCNDTIVGLTIIEHLTDLDAYHANYQLYKWININVYDQGACLKIVHGLVVPQFEIHYPFFIREIMRLTNSAIIFDSCPDKETDETLTSFTSIFVNLKPRKFQHFSLNKLLEIHLNENYRKPLTETYSLRFLTRRLSFNSKTDCNLRFVIVGLNEITLGLLQFLFFSKRTHHLNFTNITLISQHGFGYSSDNPSVILNLFNNSHQFNRRRLKQLFLKRYVHLVYDEIDYVDSVNKIVQVKSDKIIGYDYLIINNNLSNLFPKVDQKIPKNIFVINNDIDARNSIVVLKEIYEQDPLAFNKKILVFGNTLNAFRCVQTIQELGVLSNKIGLITPPREQDVYSFSDVIDNGYIDQLIRKEMRNLKIDFIPGTRISGWTFPDNSSNFIQSVMVQTRFKIISYDCLALFYYGNKNVPDQFLLALNSLEMTNRNIVIDKWFLTSDECIFASGEFTVPKESTMAKIMCHRNFCNAEIGKKLAKSVLFKSKVVNLIDDEPEFQVYKKPLIFDCKLPGHLHYLKVQKPGVIVPHEVAIQNPNFGRILETGNLDELGNQGFFQLKINPLGKIETIVCLNKNNFNTDNLIQIWNKHEQLFNNLMTRYDNGLIRDFFDYFNEPWTCAIYYDRFLDNFESQIKSLLNNKELVNEITEMYTETNWKYLTHERWKYLENKIYESGVQIQIEKDFLNYLFENRDVLTMYLHPNLIRNLIHNWHE